MTEEPDTEPAPRDDHDSPWKEALERYFPEFLALLFPQVYAGIDWSRGHAFLDKELQQVVRDAETGRRYADKLVRVYSTDGTETWVLVHVEIQGELEPEGVFAERMYVYNYRLRDRYKVPVASIAVLADTSPAYRPDCHQQALWGCELTFRFPVAKLLDWGELAAWGTLEASDNVFALVVMAQLRAKTTREPEERKAWKFRLVRSLYERGYSPEVILELFRVIDWMIRLPDASEESFRERLYELEEERKMPYVTTVEKAAIQKGLQQGEAAVLIRQMERKFGTLTDAQRRRIETADAETLLEWSERILVAGSPDEVLR